MNYTYNLLRILKRNFVDKILETRLNASSGHIAKAMKLQNYFIVQVKAEKRRSHIRIVKMISSQDEI